MLKEGGLGNLIGVARSAALQDPYSSLIIEERLHIANQCSVHLAKLLVLVLGGVRALLAFKESLAVLVELEGSDDAVAGVDGNVSLLGVNLLALDFLNIDASAAAVDGLDLALTTLEGADVNFHGITLAHGEGAGKILVAELLGELARHHAAADAGGGGKVGLAGLSALAGNACVIKARQLVINEQQKSMKKSTQKWQFLTLVGLHLIY